MSSMRATSTRVSVIVPFMNAQPFITEAIESVLAQSYPAWELLLVDDGSTDGSRAVAQRYAERYPEKILCLEHDGRQNRGVSASLNLAMVRARGDYIALLDADDLCKPHRLEKQVAFLDAHPEVALLGSWFLLIDEKGTYLEKVRPPCEDRELRWELFFNNPFANSAVMLRRKPVLSQVGLHDESCVYAKDYELWCRIADRFLVANLPEHLASRRVHRASMTSTYPDATPEFTRLRMARINSLLEWENSGDTTGEARLAAISALYFGWAMNLEPARLSQATADLLELHAAFYEREGIRSEEVQQRTHSLRARIAANLVMLTVFCSSDRVGVRGRLLAHAWRLDRRVFLHPRTLARAGRAIAGTYIPHLRRAPAAIGPPEPAGRP